MAVIKSLLAHIYIIMYHIILSQVGRLGSIETVIIFECNYSIYRALNKISTFPYEQCMYRY